MTMMAMLFILLILSIKYYGKSSTSEFNADLELLLNKLFLHLALASGILKHLIQPSCAHDPFKQ
jgi:hypothetical protein